MAITTDIVDLPSSLQRALSSLGYGRKHINIEVREQTSIQCLGGDGYRAFVALVDLATGRCEVTRGSWGGANMFNPHNPVDLDPKIYTIPENVAVITGSEGGNRPVYASIRISPKNVVLALPAPSEVSDREKSILLQYAGLTSAGRKNEWERHPKSKPLNEEIDALVARGLLNKNKAGAVSITTKGRNAAR